jgi:mono/diheme cytochrome c family protein
VIVSNQIETLALPYKHSAAGSGKDYLFAFKVILLCAALATILGICRAQGKSGQKLPVRKPDLLTGKQTFLKYCASCHGEGAKGNGPAATALMPPPSDLTTLARRHDGEFPSGYVGALLKFGRNVVAHGSDDMPVWGFRFRDLDANKDPTGQQHVDDVVAYIQSLQVK